MKGRSLVLFLLVYLTLDVANPFLPGAVTFVDGRLEVIDAGRPPGHELPMPDGASEAAAPHREPAVVRPSSPPAAPGARLRRWRIPARRASSTMPEPAPSSEDH